MKIKRQITTLLVWNRISTNIHQEWHFVKYLHGSRGFRVSKYFLLDFQCRTAKGGFPISGSFVEGRSKKNRHWVADPLSIVEFLSSPCPLGRLCPSLPPLASILSTSHYVPRIQKDLLMLPFNWEIPLGLPPFLRLWVKLCKGSFKSRKNLNVLWGEEFNSRKLLTSKMCILQS